MTHFFGTMFVCCAVLFTNVKTYPQYRNQQKQSIINYSEGQPDTHVYGPLSDILNEQNFHSFQMTPAEFKIAVQNENPYETKRIRYETHFSEEDGSSIEKIQERLKQLLKKDLEEQVRKLQNEHMNMNYSPVEVNMNEYGSDVMTHSTKIIYPPNGIVRSIEHPFVHIQQQQQRIIPQENKKSLKPVPNPNDTSKISTECSSCCEEKQNTTCSSCCSTDFIPLLTAAALKSIAG